MSPLFTASPLTVAPTSEPFNCHVPGPSGVPPSPFASGTFTSLEQMSKTPLVPALGSWLMVMFTDALEAPHPLFGMVYVYVPDWAVAGFSVPPVKPPGPLQFAAEIWFGGVSKRVNKSTGESDSQKT